MDKRVSDERLKKLKEDSLLFLARRVAAGGNVLHGGFPDGVKPFQQVLIDVFDDLRDARAEIARLAAQRDNWEEFARQFCRNAEFYRDIVVSIGEKFGHDAYVSDDGSVQHDVLALKVPELVDKLRVQLAAAEAKIERVKDIRYGYVKAFPGSGQGYISHEDVLRALADTEVHNGE